MTAPDLRELPTKDWPAGWLETWDERAALVEDGCPGISRKQAEARAREMVIAMWLREQQGAGR